MDDPLRAALTSALGEEVAKADVVRGGDVASSYRVELAGGRVLFAKTHPNPPAGFFGTEAAGLRWLHEAGAVAVPEVVAVSDDDPTFLVLEWIDEGRPGTTTEPSLGTGLAKLHRAGAPSFGREDRRTTGSRGLPNEPCATWAEFYATNRLLPLARIARDEDAVPAHALAMVEELAGRLGEVGAADEAPARLHGDLWSGNRLVGADGSNWLIDPASHGGHREFDLAMMRLFGGFGNDCFEAYEAAWPLAEGWGNRIPLHQIAPLLVHAIKFGGGYVGASERAIERARRLV